MPADSPVPAWRMIGPALCVVVLLTLLIAVLYAAWVSFANYSRIGV